MTPYQVYEQYIKPLSAEEKFAITRLIIDEVVPEAGPKAQANGTGQNGHLPQGEPEPPATARKPREFGAGRHLLEGVNIEALLATPIDDIFADYMLEDPR